MIGHYQKLQDLDEGFPDLIKKIQRKRKGELFKKSSTADEEKWYEVQFPIQTKLINVNTDGGFVPPQPPAKPIKEKHDDDGEEASPRSNSRSHHAPKPT